MFTGPVGPVEVFFYWPEAVFGNFYWPGAIGSPLVSSPAQVNTSICLCNLASAMLKMYLSKAVLKDRCTLITCKIK